jgi:hypothetical protein
VFWIMANGTWMIGEFFLAMAPDPWRPRSL